MSYPIRYDTPLLVEVIVRTCQLAWWLLRGSAYGIWLCLRPQLSVPAEGWRIIGRAIQANEIARYFLIRFLHLGLAILITYLMHDILF